MPDPSNTRRDAGWSMQCYANAFYAEKNQRPKARGSQQQQAGERESRRHMGQLKGRSGVSERKGNDAMSELLRVGRAGKGGSSVGGHAPGVVAVGS